MDYKSTLEVLEDFWNASAWCSKHRVQAWAILHPLFKVGVSWVLLFVVSKVPFSLSVNFESCHMD